VASGSRFWIWLLFFCVVEITCVHAQSAKETYDLQERCGKRAAEIYQKDFGQNVTSDTSSTVIANYENHYNLRLNKCFMLEDSMTYTKDAKEGIKILTLADINENKIYGSFDPMECTVQERSCHSEQEWRALIKPYMEE
jgi:hypothetical protein